MSKVTISDFIVAVFDLLEAEGKALKDNSELFFKNQQQNLKQTIKNSAWAIGFITVSFISLIAAIAFFMFGLYKVLSVYICDMEVPFILSVVLVCLSLIFGYIASKR